MSRSHFSMARLGGLFVSARSLFNSGLCVVLWLLATGSAGSARRRVAGKRLLTASRIPAVSPRLFTQASARRVCLFFLFAFLFSAFSVAVNPPGELSLVRLSDRFDDQAPTRSLIVAFALPQSNPGSPFLPFSLQMQTPPPELRSNAARARALGLSAAPIPKRVSETTLEALRSAEASVPDNASLFFSWQDSFADGKRPPFHALYFQPLTPASPFGELVNALTRAKAASWSAPQALFSYANPASPRFLDALAASDTVKNTRLSSEELAAARLGALIEFQQLPQRFLNDFLFAATLMAFAWLAYAMFSLTSILPYRIEILIAPLSAAENAEAEAGALLDAAEQPAPLSSSSRSKARL